MSRRIVLLLWTVLVLYPNPTMLFVSAQRAWSPPVDPQAVRELAATLPDDPRAIEAAVNSWLVPYAVPWQTYGVPWYFPTAAEVLRDGRGDCEARAVVLASILHAKGIPARFVGSFDHLWVDYPGKHGVGLEAADSAMVVQQPDGGYRLHWPSLVDWRASWRIEREYFWDAMPAWRGWLLLAGWLLIGWWRRERVRRLVPAARAGLPRLARLTPAERIHEGTPRTRIIRLLSYLFVSLRGS